MSLKDLLVWPRKSGKKQCHSFFFLSALQLLSIRWQRWLWLEHYLTPHDKLIYWNWHWTAVTHGYWRPLSKTYTQLIDPVAVRKKLQDWYRVSCWQVGRGFCPIIGGKGWSRIRRATRIDLMRTWYDCCGTGERHTLICAHSKPIGLVENGQNEVAERAVEMDRER